VEEKIQGRVVLIGANWHQLGSNRGDLVDSYSTPVGKLPGVFIHANYVQAILDGRSFQLFEWNTLVEWFFGLLLTYVTALPTKWWWKAGPFVLVLCAPFVASYIALQNWGVCDSVQYHISGLDCRQEGLEYNAGLPLRTSGLR